MKRPVHTTCVLLLTLHALAVCGCGGDDPPRKGTMSVCGVACADPEWPPSEIHLSGSPGCESRFLAFEEAHPGQVCGHAWERVPTTPCLGTFILTTIMLIPCSVKCTESPDYQPCILECVIAVVRLEGNCVECIGATWVDLQRCLLRPSPSEDDVSACLRTYIQESSSCTP